MIIKFAAAAAFMALAAAGHAMTVTSAFGSPDSGPAMGETMLVDFNSTTLPTGYALSGGYGYATGTTSFAAAPAGDTTQYLYVSSALTPNNATLTTAHALKSISFYWGSIDAYNTVDVLGAGGVSLGSYGGSAFAPANGDQSAASTNRRVYFTAGSGQVITGLRFASTGVAFELDDVAGTAVPEPAAWALMIVGFGMVGFAARRRRATTPAVAA
ncbi:Npun_F0296 family exosortase-dependent surface protein [Glacieibacterium megasporae]|uniref:Npun_F0296 family exosortase-dependent surface protein n=1 Tax=Glacieibacterium megasporae TaxID=2835787 RepID=UPI0021025D23|nr:PEPxxWA-CTERM sorting domain-containing protein [Polymorphobacter megasporae]